MNTKRKSNVTALKFKYLSPTNFKGARIKIIQLNNRKSKIIDRAYRLEVIDQAIDFLENHPDVVSYSLLTDNTQTDYHLFSIETEDSSYPELI